MDSDSGCLLSLALKGGYPIESNVDLIFLAILEEQIPLWIVLALSSREMAYWSMTAAQKEIFWLARVRRRIYRAL